MHYDTVCLKFSLYKHSNITYSSDLLLHLIDHIRLISHRHSLMRYLISTIQRPIFDCLTFEHFRCICEQLTSQRAAADHRAPHCTTVPLSFHLLCKTHILFMTPIEEASISSTTPAIHTSQGGSASSKTVLNLGRTYSMISCHPFSVHGRKILSFDLLLSI